MAPPLTEALFWAGLELGMPRDIVPLLELLASDDDISVPVDIGDAIIELDVEACMRSKNAAFLHKQFLRL